MKSTENQPDEPNAGATVSSETSRAGQNGGEKSMSKPNEQQVEEHFEQVTGEVSKELSERRTAVEGGIAEAKETVREGAEKAVNLASEGAEKAVNLASEGVEKVGDLASEGVAKVGDLASEGAERAGGLARAVQQTSRDVAQSMRGVAKRAPVPAALTGLGAACAGTGVTWLLIGQRRRSATNGAKGRSSIEESITSTELPGTAAQPEKVEAVETRAEGAIAHAAHETQHLAQRAEASIEDAAHGAAARIRRVARDARAEGQLLEEAAEKKFREHPLAVGTGLVAIGTVIGASLPSTVRENRWLGKRRDAFMSRARSTARGAARKLESLGRASPASSH